ncbi:MAG: DUF2974 domain-containing protein, partial [Alphaproteobacteria bacterium]|nr:DUF2974 domain-containing protein [Alphaproteobacteria bacterium]
MTNANLGLDAADIAYLEMAEGGKINRPGSPLDGYTVDKRFGPSGSGAAAYGLSNANGDVVIAFRGTQDLTDVVDDVGNLGYRQWEEDLKADVTNYLDANWTGEVTFAGHSLGGALAQYAAYDIAGAEPGRKGDMNLYTFNGLGGLNGIEENESGGVDLTRMNGINATHYFNGEDWVSRLGGDHLGGETRRVPSAAIGPDGIYTAHALGEFDNGDLAASVAADPRYYDNATLQKNPEAVVELLGAAANLTGKPITAWTLQDVQRMQDAASRIPVSELADTALMLADFTGASLFEIARQAGKLEVKIAGIIVDTVIDAVDRTVGAAVDLGSAVANTAIDALGRVLNAARELGGKVGDAIRDKATDALDGLRDALDKAGDWLDDLGDWLNPFNDDFEEAINASIPRLRDPIVLDLNGDGVKVISRAESGVRFDFDGDGLVEESGWLSRRDAFLAIDWNRDGKINDISELFGDALTSGFSAMAALDTNGDLILDASDALWNRLRLWRDSNTNGQTDAGELLKLSTFDIVSIDLHFTRVNFTAEANLISEKGVYTKSDGTSLEIADVWFDFNNLNSKSLTASAVSAATALLPNLRGYGDVPDLHVAMENDATLRLRVEALATIGAADLPRLHDLVEEIALRWTGAFAVDPTSRGPNFDARYLAALEAATDTPFNANGITDPAAQSVPALNSAWDEMMDAISARLFAQSVLKDALPPAVYKVENDRLYLLGDEVSTLNALKAKAPGGDPAHQAAYWAAAMTVLRVQEAEGGFDLAEPDAAALLKDILEPLGLYGLKDQLTDWQSLGQGVPFDGSVARAGMTIFGDLADDITIEGNAPQAVFGNGGDDYIYTVGFAAQTISGGAGRDRIRGGNYNDWIDGGTGADTMLGQGGNDTYVVDNAGDLVFETSSQGTDLVLASLDWTLGSNLENLTLTELSALNGTGNGLANVLTGNAAANRLLGLGGNDILDGREGADRMEGGTGDDVYIVDDAGDTIVERRNGGTDRVETALNHVLDRNVENLTLLGTADIDGTGNALRNIIVGNDGANTLDGGVSGSDQLYGRKGDDTYLVRNSGANAYENADEGKDTVRSTVSFTLGSYIENLVLLGNLDISGTGNSEANRIVGNAGNNTLNGQGGADRMLGGKGDDTYYVDDAGDIVTELAGAGVDTVRSSISHSLAQNVENLVLAGYIDSDGAGNAGDNQIEGNNYVNVLDGINGNDALFGYAGDDTLKGGRGNDLLDGGSGADTMRGGAGNDTYFVDDAADRVIEKAKQGKDTVQSAVTFALGAGLEDLILTGSGDKNGTGNAGANQLRGNDYANILDGRGGRDVMIGQAGNDIYIVDNAGDVVEEYSGQGVDEVRSSVAWTLGAFVENLTLTGVAKIDGKGNDFNNVLIGNAARNRLTGLAGNDRLDGMEAADIMIGGTGNDTYVVDTRKDRVIEDFNAGTDTVESSISLKLAANVEHLTLTGSANLNGTGNALSNTITGNDGNNRLDSGASGDDRLYGGLGDDTYILRNASAYAYEAAAAGDDLVKSQFSYSLGANLERLTLTGSRDIDGAGNDLNNVLTGNKGNNTLDGRTGADRMSGGGGDDIYYVDNTGDRVIETANGGDDLVIASVSFTLGLGVEDLRLTGSNPIDGTGNELANVMEGTATANRLTGKAGDDSI